jgi:microcystin-dependent protein
MNNLVNIRDGLSAQYARLNKDIYKNAIDVGDFKMSSRSDDFNGWLLCDGRDLQRSAYQELYGVIGTTFGSSSSDTFRLPDFRGRVLGQAGNGVGLTNRPLGTAVGSEIHTLTAQEMPAHTHSGTTASDGNHAHTATTESAGAHTHPITDPGHTHSQTTINDDFNNSGTRPPGFTADSAGDRTWNNINSSITGITINSAGAHAHDVTVNTAGAHTHSFTTDSSGTGGAHNNMQPTLFGVHMFIYCGLPVYILRT